MSQKLMYNEDLIKTILRTLAKKGVYLTTVRAQKLLYLIERQCVLNEGERRLWLDFRYDRFGMYSPALNGIIVSLDPRRDGVRVEAICTARGNGRGIHYAKRLGCEDMLLPKNIETAIVRVLADWMYLDTPTLIARAKQTSPFVYAKPGQKIDWDALAEENCRKDEELTEEAGQRMACIAQEAGSGHCRAFENSDDAMNYLFS